MVNTSMTVIEPEFSFFEVQVERMPWHAVELDQSALGIAPKALNAVDMDQPASKLVVAVIDTQVFVKPDVDQAVIAAPAIGMNDAGDVSASPDDGLQRAFGGVWHDLGVDLVGSFEQTKDDRLVARTPTPEAAHPARAKVRLIGFKIAAQWRFGLAMLSQATTHAQVQGVDRAHGNATELGAVCGRQIHGEVAQNLAGFGRTDF